VLLPLLIVLASLVNDVTDAVGGGPGTVVLVLVVLLVVEDVVLVVVEVVVLVVVGSVVVVDVVDVVVVLVLLLSGTTLDEVEAGAMVVLTLGEEGATIVGVGLPSLALGAAVPAT